MAFFLPLDQSNKKPPEVPREAVWYILNWTSTITKLSHFFVL